MALTGRSLCWVLSWASTPAASATLEVIISACLGATIALGMSGLSSAYISESAERKQELEALEDAMVSDLQQSAHGRAARLVPLWIGLVNGLAPLLISLIIMLPLWLARGTSHSPQECAYRLYRSHIGDYLPAWRIPRQNQRYLLALGGPAHPAGRPGDRRRYLAADTDMMRAKTGEPATAIDSAQPLPVRWYTLTPEETARQQRVDPAWGLGRPGCSSPLPPTTAPTGSPRARPRSLPAMLLDQLRDVMILVLLAAALVSGVIGEFVDTVAIGVIIVLNAVIGTAQEYRAERAVAALRAMARGETRVIRNGQRQTLASEELVPGDVVWLEAGNVIAADIRLIEAADLELDQSALTGRIHGRGKNQRAPGLGTAGGGRPAQHGVQGHPGQSWAR